ncbi:MAG: ABC transporter ATP-binding protein [Synergistaceae bacterium]|jgi:simple sugar transport system ATP-binding protein|nr:ABC transporter ATP-binding protein [Synergistaceae bacterium]
MNGDEYILEMRNITKTFGDLVANDGVTLRVKKGSVHALVGENGAGKSTLMNVLACLYKQDYGDIVLNGRHVHFRNSRDAARSGIGMVHQEFMLFKDLTVLENIMYGFEEKTAWIFINKRKTKRKIKEICEKYHFNIPLEAKVNDLPVSMLQQVEIVKVLYKGADIIVLDEPTSVLTPQGVEGLFDAIRFLARSGKTIIFITHKLKEVFAVADTITVLRDGRVTGNVRPEDVNENELARLMVGREVMLQADRSARELGGVFLRAEDVSVRDKDGVLRLKHANFDIREGEIVGIAGVAGSGQQQLVEAIFGLSGVEEGGKITFLGQDITRAEPRERRRMGMGYVPQDRLGVGANALGTVWENSIMGYHISHGFKSKVFLRHKEIDEFTGRVVSQFNVKTPNIYEKLGNLSGGNIQKLIVGRESIQDNRLLIVEDPTRGIDVGAVEFVWAKMLEIASSGRAILLVSHELNEVMQLSDRILVVYNGEIFDGGRYQEKNDREIGLLMLGGGESDAG